MTCHTLSKTVLIIALCFSLAQCSGEKEKKPTNVILITLDTHRVDYVSAYNQEMAKTPNIDFFAQKGIKVENCYSVIPITAPSHASLFYSLPPHLLHLYNNGQVFRAEKKMLSLAELFRKKGFQTAAFISLGVLQSHFALNQGFDLYDDEMRSQRWYLTAQEINEKVFPWLEKNKENEFFAWIHYSDPHDPYAPPTLPPDLRIDLNGELAKLVCLQKYETLTLNFRLKKGANSIRFTVLNPYPGSQDLYRAALNEIEFSHRDPMKLSFSDIHFVERETKQSALIKSSGSILIDCPSQDAELTIKARGNLQMHPAEKIQAYRQEVEYLDQQIGVLKKKLMDLDLLDKCLIVLVGDHGEGLGENKTKYGDRYFGHIHFLNGIYMKVPLIIYDPAREKKAEGMSGTATVMDVAPTIVGRMGWKKNALYKGRDLFENKKAPRSLFEETYEPEAIYDRFGILEYPWHMIYTPETQNYQLFHLASDSGERNDVYERNKNVDQIKKIQEMLRQKTIDIIKLKREVNIDTKSLEMLKSLGYIK
jgi:arylsulfatase A-like enzyme